MARSNSGNHLRWSILAAFALVATAAVLQDNDGVEESVRRFMDWILMPGIVAVGLAMPSTSFLVMLLLDWILYAGVFFLAFWGATKAKTRDH